MAIFRGTGGAGDSTDDSIVSEVTEQAGIATTKAQEAATSATNASNSASSASSSETAASNSATAAAGSASTATTKASEAASHASDALASKNAAATSATAAADSATAANSANVQTVAGLSTEITNLNGIRTDITGVNAVRADVVTVSGISSDVTTVAADASDIGTVATNITNVNNVGDNISNVNAVHSNASNINTVAADGSDIGTVAGNISNVNTVAGISSDVTTVAGLESKMDAVIADASDIGAVAGNIGNVNTVAGDSSDINTVAGISADVTAVADNMTDVQNADTNAANAATSASNASDSASAASTSASSASSSASSASTSATNAGNSASAASNSATAASASKDAAASSASAASGSASAAASSASAASTSASNAATSETNSEGSENASALSATAAATSASNAATSESNAATSATNAAVSETNAAASETNAAASYDSFDDRYLGVKSSAPSTDNDGGALLTGALYFNSTNNTMNVFTGSAWAAVANNNIINPNVALTQDLATNGNDVKFGDNDKATFGAGDDLQIYHDGFNSHIKESGAGSLLIDATNTYFRNAAGTKDYAWMVDGGAVSLFHNNALKLATTSTGIDVTGTATMDGLTVTKASGDIATLEGTGTTVDVEANLVFNPVYDVNARIVSARDGSGLFSRIAFETAVDNTGNTIQRLNIGSHGDISFYEDTGTTPKLFWDASAESLGIGTSTPYGSLHTQVTVNTAWTSSSRATDWIVTENLSTTASSYSGIEMIATGTGNAGVVNLACVDSGSGSGDFVVSTRNSGTFAERLRIDSSGRVGIGTSSPSNDLHVKNATGNPQLRLSDSTGNVELQASDAVFYLNNIHANGQFVFRNGTGYTERMRIDSSGNMLVGKTATGTGTVGAELRANGFNAFVRDGGEVMNINRLSSDGTIVDFRKDSSTVGSIGNSGNRPYFASTNCGIRLGAADLLPATSTGVISDNVVSLGSSAGRWKNLYLSGTANVGYVNGSSSVSIPDNYSYGFGGTGSNTYISGSNAANSIWFRTNGNERARIDSSGNLLVGTTQPRPAEFLHPKGISLRGDIGQIQLSTDGNPAMFLNRDTNDGQFMEFRREGSTVGSIGTVNGDMYLGTGDTGLFFSDGANYIMPYNVSTPGLADGLLDLGRDTNRFKDLYLSGGVYLGGTGSANKLDDYEEGTWTPTIQGLTSGSITGFSVQEATYTKIGDTVRLSCYLSNINMPTSTISGAYFIGGLPFASDAFSDVANATFCNMFSFDESDVSISGHCTGSSIKLFKGSSITSITDADEGPSTGAAIMISVIYKT